MSESYLVVSILVLISVLTGLDLVNDLGEGVAYGHLLIETLIIAICTFGIVLFILKLKSDKQRLNTALDQARTDLRYWKSKSSKLIQGLSQEIETQLEEWSLTKSEKDIAILLIKGFSTKEIAQFRKTAVKTVRVQTSSIYKKAQVSNRNELTAFFLEDLLLPSNKRTV